jgi:hypothetical protein
MPPVSAAAHLRDDENLEDLRRNETRLPAAAALPLPEGTLEALEDGLPIVQPQIVGLRGSARLDYDTEEALAVFGSEAEDSAPAIKRLSRDQVVWLTTGFLTLILMGMAGATLVFIQRAVEIVGLLR